MAERQVAPVRWPAADLEGEGGGAAPEVGGGGCGLGGAEKEKEGVRVAQNGDVVSIYSRDG